jgi:RimJ/RimL family protein N-acetyltransferase
VVYADNERSIALAERLGFVRVGRTRDTFTYLIASESRGGRGTTRYGDSTTRSY